jgi:hypothetical protein
LSERQPRPEAGTAQEQKGLGPRRTSSPQPLGTIGRLQETDHTKHVSGRRTAPGPRRSWPRRTIRRGPSARSGACKRPIAPSFPKAAPSSGASRFVNSRQCRSQARRKMRGILIEPRCRVQGLALRVKPTSALRLREVQSMPSRNESTRGKVEVDRTARYWCTMTTVPLLGSIWMPCHPSGTGGSVKRNTRIASIGARLMQPWLRGMPKRSCQ